MHTVERGHFRTPGCDASRNEGRQSLATVRERSALLLMEHVIRGGIVLNRLEQHELVQLKENNTV